MNNPALILYLEDNPRDTELARDKLRQIAMPHELRVASDRAEYEAALAQARFDLILSDYALPDYDGMAALALAREKQPDVPFILISGTLGEERAVDCVVRGATDYVLKQNLNRLVPAVLRALTEAEERQKRQQAEALLRIKDTAVASAIAGIAIADLDGRINYVNAAWLHMHGHDSDTEVRGTTPLQHVQNPADVEAVIKAIKQEGLWTGEMVCSRRDGSYFTAEMATNLMTDSSGRPMGMLASFQDITERKRAEEVLRRFKRAVESATDAIGMSAADGKHYYQNKAFDDLFGEIGQNPPATLYVDEAVGRKVFDTIMSGAAWNGEVQMRGKSGKTLEIMLRAYAMKDELGTVTGLVGVHTNITERKLAEEKMKQQLDELRRWHEATLGREGRVLELKREVNELAAKLGEKPKYGEAQEKTG